MRSNGQAAYVSRVCSAADSGPIGRDAAVASLEAATVERRRFTVLLGQDLEARLWVTQVPALDFLSTFGETRDEALAKTQEAILGYLEAAAKEGIPRGSYHYLRKPGATRLVVAPLHGNRDMPAGTLRSILCQADLPSRIWSSCLPKSSAPLLMLDRLAQDG